MDLHFRVKRSLLLRDQRVLKVPGDTINNCKCHFRFKDGWDNTRITAVFKSASFGDTKLVELNSDNTCEIPWEILSRPGTVLCSLFGTIIENESVVYRITTNVVGIIVIEDAPVDGSKSKPPTPSEFEQFMIDLKKDLVLYANDVFDSYVDEHADEWRELIAAEQDPTVPAWAKASTKPIYTYDEVGAAAFNHTHDDVYAAKIHNHDDRYYTESEVDTELISKVNKSGDTMTGLLTLKRDTTIAQNTPAELKLSVHQTDNDVMTSTAFIRVYDDHDANYYGANMVIQSGGNMIIGSGESPTNVYNALINGTSSDDDEYTYITSDQEIYFDSACNTIANRKRVAIDTSGNVDIQSGGSFTKSGIKIHNNITQITGTYKATTANTWEYSDKSFTVPSGHMYLVKLQLGWTSGKPIGVGIHTSTNLGTAGFPTHHFVDSDGMYNSPVFLLYAGTYYLFEKRATVPSSANTYWINAIDLLLSS